MRHGVLTLALAPVLLVAAGCALRADHAAHPMAAPAAHAHPTAPARWVPDGAGAPLFGDLGALHRPVTTSSELAQRYFDQGLVLTYGFNHAEAIRSFREASRLDPTCAMCFWGEAYALGPNINAPMDPAANSEAWHAIRAALTAAGGATPVERALVTALAARYAADPPADRTRLDRAYADAMRRVARRHPADDDVQVLFAEALMDTMPWDYYRPDGTPKPDTAEAIAALESVMARTPDHPGAIHYYIHAVEPSATPARAEAPADRLRDLVPGAGHLVHMPAHVYLRVGRYHDAAIANEKAAAADESYITQCRAQGYYPAAYYPHNVHFLWAAASFEGRSAVAIAAADKLDALIPDDAVDRFPFVEEFLPIGLYARVRFGRWHELLAWPAPPARLRYVTGVWHFARGMALAATGRTADAEREAARVGALARDADLDALEFASFATAGDLLGIAEDVLGGRIAVERGDFSEATRRLEAAVAAQDALRYTEPPPWYFPIREALGDALLRAGRPVEAEAVFRTQLAKTPRNGWSLTGLVAALEAEGRHADAAAAERERADAWQLADVTLPGAVF
jgi:tetratricopeptide (TPR) repeat protein